MNLSFDRCNNNNNNNNNEIVDEMRMSYNQKLLKSIEKRTLKDKFR